MIIKTAFGVLTIHRGTAGHCEALILGDLKMADYSKMKCHDMKLFLFEWVALNPKKASGIKYIGNMSRTQLIKVCSYTENKIDKEELMELIIYIKVCLKEYRVKMKNRREGRDSDCDDSDDSSDDDSDDE